MTTIAWWKRRIERNRVWAISFAVGFALMAIVISEADQLPVITNTPFANLVETYTNCKDCADAKAEVAGDCETVADACGGDCTQATRQTRSLVAAMATAIFTIVSVAATRWRVAYVVAAGGFGLKAVFNQMMYISNGDLMLPIAIIIVSALCAIASGGVWVAAAAEGPDQEDEDSERPNEGQ